MINIVVGDNATGKTNVVMQNYSMNQNNAASNFNNDLKSKIISLNRNKLDYVISELDLSSVKSSDTEIVYAEMEDHLGEIMVVNREFLKIITLLCKDVNTICLDEPELNLDQYELWTLVEILKEYDFDTDVWISTHEILFADLVNAKFYMVDGVLRSIDRRKAIECIGTI